MNDGIGGNGGPKSVCFGGAGWVAISRSIRDHWLVGFGKPGRPADPTRGAMSFNEAFVDLIMECRYEEGFVRNGGHKMELRRGELLGAVSWLAHRWNWTPKAVRRLLDDLENDGMIELKSPSVQLGKQQGKHVGKLATIITLCNYGNYQDFDMQHGQTKGQTNEQTRGKRGANEGQTRGNIYKDNKLTKEQGNKEEEGSCAADAAPTDAAGQAFEVFWELFPAERRRGKGKCRDLFRQIVSGKGKRRASADVLIAGIRNGNGVDPEFPPMPETWLNQGRWEDAPPEASKDPSPVEGKSWGWWRGMEPKLRGLSHERWLDAIDKLKPNGTWPWWMLGAPPGHPECVVPEQIVTDRKWSEKYGGKITNV